MRIKLIACEVVYRELCLCVAKSRNIVDVEFATQGLHDLKNEEMCARLQEKIDAIDETKYEAVALGYALCNNGLRGLRARRVPIVLPRAHDCITFFFGSRRAYQEYFDAHPGTYYMTTGWAERDHVNLEQTDGVMKQLGLDRTYHEYVEKYGEENAKYIMETMGGWESNYSGCLYIDMGVKEDLGYDDEARKDAGDKGWSFEKIEGDMSLMQRLVDGDWDSDDFLVVPPGHRIIPTNDERVLAAEAV